jgi:hypothetical protein
VKPRAEIDETLWVDPSALPDLPLAPLTRDFILPLARSVERLGFAQPARDA